MKTVLVPLIGDTEENLFQLGKKEAESFARLEERVIKLISPRSFLWQGKDILMKARSLLKKKDGTFFTQCIGAYSEGLGVDASDYLSFLSLFELAAHYGQAYPELKGIIPGCTSLFEKNADGFTHARLIDFPLMGIFDLAPRLYYWKCNGKATVMNYSCEGLAPLFFQSIHQSGFSMALHHKPGGQFHSEGQSIFQIAFDGMFESSSMNDYRKGLKKKMSIAKWGFYMMNSSGTVIAIDVDGPASNMETFSLTETPVLVFNNVPIRHDSSENFDQYMNFCHHRQHWLIEKLEKKSKIHNLDLMTDVKDQQNKKWKHPAATLSTVGAFQVNLTNGEVHVKEGEGALVASDAIIELSLADQHSAKILKASAPQGPFEKAWKSASAAQSAFDQGNRDEAYHKLQMAIALMPEPHWKEIFTFYLHVWNFKFVPHKKELSLIYRAVKAQKVPEILTNQWHFLCMRLEKKLGLAFTVHEEQVPLNFRDQFKKERDSRPAVFSANMNQLYPRLEILDVFSPQPK